MPNTKRQCILIYVILSGTFLSTYGQESGSNYSQEKLSYSIHYGLFKIGEATIWTESNMDADSSSLIQCSMKTTGFLRFFASLDYCIETTLGNELLPQTTLWSITNSKRKEAKNETFQYSDSLKIHTFRQHSAETKDYSFGLNDIQIRDALSTYTWLRNQSDDYLKDASVGVFYNRKIYKVRLMYETELDYKLKNSTIRATRYRIILPVSADFPEGKYAYVTVSKDDNRMPLELKADMGIGTLYFRLKKDSRD